MASAKWSSAMPTGIDADGDNIDTGVVTSTPILTRQMRDVAVDAVASPAMEFATPLSGTPIKRKTERMNREIGASTATPPFSVNTTKKAHASVVAITNAASTSPRSSPSHAPARRLSPASSLHTADMKNGVEDIEAKIFVDDDNDENDDVVLENGGRNFKDVDDGDLDLPLPPPEPPFCAITMTPKSTRKIADAASFLQRETEKYGVDATKDNVVMKSANAMSLRMRDIADFFHFSHQHLRSRPASSSGGSVGRNDNKLQDHLSTANDGVGHDDDDDDEEDKEKEEPAIRSKEDLLAASRAISADGDVVVRFAKTIARLCADHVTSKVDIVAQMLTSCI